MNVTSTIKHMVEDQIFFLNHEIRRPLSNVVSISEMLLCTELSDTDKGLVFHNLKSALADFDKALAEFDHIIE